MREYRLTIWKNIIIRSIFNWPVYFFILLLTNFATVAQEGNNWTFWNQLGLSFNTEPPTFYKAAQQNPWFCSTASDSLGNLLFYTNGDTVWNKNHVVMNGGVLNTNIGCKSIGQGVIILSSPLDKNIYYIFESGNDKYYTLHSACDTSEPLKFAIVDMSKNNGQGAVTLGYKNLTAQNCYELTACYQSNKHDYWIVTRTIDSLIAFPVTKLGIGNPVYSYAPENIGFGNMKLSHNGEYMVFLCNTSQSRTGNQLDTANISIYKFDIFTGKFSNTQKVFFDYPSYSLYGIEFSPNDSLFYVTVGHKEYKNDTTTYLLQFETYNTNVKSSLYILKSDCSFPITTAINLAPNGKIYFTSGNGSIVYFNVITKPDMKGEKCDIKPKYIEVPDWGKQKLNYSFPNILYRYIKCYFEYTIECKGLVTFKNLSDTFSLSKYIWSWGDGDSDIVYSNNSPFINHKYKSPGKYFVKLKGISPFGYIAWNSDTVNVGADRFGLIAGFTYKNSIGCQYVSYNFIDTSKTKIYDTTTGTVWHWFFGDGYDTAIVLPPTNIFTGKGAISHRYTKSGNFTVKLIFHNGYCSDTFICPQQIFIAPAPQPSFVVDPNNGCIPQIFHVNPLHRDSVISEEYYIYDRYHKLKDSFINKSSKATLPKGFVFSQNDTIDSIIYIKQFLTGTSGCITQDSSSIRLYNPPLIKLVNDTTICRDEVLQISATSGNYKYSWNTGDTSQSIIINRGGTFSVKVINGACTVSDSIIITQDLNESCKFRVSLFPNPCNSQFTVSLYSRKEQNINIQLYELSGKQVASYSNVPIDQFGNLVVDSENLAAAMYILQLNTSEKRYTFKVIKVLE